MNRAITGWSVCAGSPTIDIAAAITSGSLANCINIVETPASSPRNERQPEPTRSSLASSVSINPRSASDHPPSANPAPTSGSACTTIDRAVNWLIRMGSSFIFPASLSSVARSAAASCANPRSSRASARKRKIRDTFCNGPTCGNFAANPSSYRIGKRA